MYKILIIPAGLFFALLLFFAQVCVADENQTEPITMTTVAQDDVAMTTMVSPTTANEDEKIDGLANILDNVIPPVAHDDDDDILDWEAPYEIRKNYPYYISGHDYENRPIWVSEFGRYNIRKTVDEGGDALRNLDRYIEQYFQRLIKSLRPINSLEDPADGVVIICDFEGFSLTQMAHLPTVSYIVQVTRKHRKTLAEVLHLGLTVNVNALGQTLINLVRPVLGSIMEKVEIYGTNRSKWIGQILKHCPKNQIPEWYGGRPDFTPIQIYG